VFPFWCFLFLCFLQYWIGLIACTGVRYEAIKPVLGYKRAAAPPLVGGGIVADLWQRGRPVASDRAWKHWPSDVWLNRGHGRFVGIRIRRWAVGITGINAFALLTPPFPPPLFLVTRGSMGARPGFEPGTSRTQTHTHTVALLCTSDSFPIHNHISVGLDAQGQRCVVLHHLYAHAGPHK